MTSIDACRAISLPRIHDPRGSLSFVEAENHIPFPIRRVFYVYGVPPGESRGAHAHHRCHQFLLCLSGALDVCVDDGVSKRTFRLDQPSVGLYIPPKIWAAETDFAPGTVLLVLASDRYEADDYLRDYDAFLEAVRT